MGIGRSYIAAITLVLGVSSAVLIGCGKPAVKHTAISGEVREIGNWHLMCEGVGDVDLRPINLKRFDSQNEYTAREYCTKFSIETRRELASKYGYTLAENFPRNGTIHLELESEKLSLWVPSPDTSNLYNDISPNDNIDRTESDLNIVGAAASLFSDRDYVKEVTVTLRDVNDNLLGTVIIGGKEGDRVKPSYVAKVIDEVLREGRYGGAKSVSVNAGGNVIP
ncbi:hypothetical protein GF377_01210 [candidate division GN15 bacterium]|nr:hypothetical protein [candidate division GN15 bacterium]